jgi:hypothetical protein
MMSIRPVNGSIPSRQHSRPDIERSPVFEGPIAMKNRRGFMLSLMTGVVALTFVAASVFADEVIGMLSKVDVEGKKITVIEKDTDKEVDLKVDDETEITTKKGSVKVDLEKIEKRVTKAKEKGRKGISVKVEHDKGVASKITYQAKKKAAAKAE